MVNCRVWVRPEDESGYIGVGQPYDANRVKTAVGPQKKAETLNIVPRLEVSDEGGASNGIGCAGWRSRPRMGPVGRL